MLLTHVNGVTKALQSFGVDDFGNMYRVLPARDSVIAKILNSFPYEFGRFDHTLAVDEFRFAMRDLSDE